MPSDIEGNHRNVLRPDLPLSDVRYVSYALAGRPEVDYPPFMLAVGRVPKHRPFAFEGMPEDTP